jgi:enterochelin esterase-like enzyme
MNNKHSVSRHLIRLLLSMFIIFPACSREDSPHIITPPPFNQDPVHYNMISVTYPSTTFDQLTRSLNVCLPSDYDSIDGELPVLYLLHGASGDKNSWVRGADIVTRLSDKYAYRIIGPMIVVMPSCEPPGSNFQGVGPDGDLFVKEMVTDIIPFIEKNFKASPDRENRAIAGYSAGGMQTLNLALFFPEKFDYVYPMSTGYFFMALNTLT